ncbi:hypothetical protein [Undibacterium sp. Ren11W]|uniref:hypothetical protein n=1 Tax=Undibacterium sp. Ren11W TaxID=3413045 RepID=UPI003BF3D094
MSFFGKLLGFGGDNSGNDTTKNSTAVTTSTSSNTQQTDNSMVMGDGSVGSFSGAGNVLDKRVINNTSFSDSSNRSTNFEDNSNKVTNTTVTDFGSVGAALAGMGATSTTAINNAGGAVMAALQSLSKQSSDNAGLMKSAFSFAGDATAAAASSAKTISESATATDQTKLVKMLAIAGVCVVGLMAWGRK